MIRFITYDGMKSSAKKLGFKIEDNPMLRVEDYGHDPIVRWGWSGRSYNSIGVPQDYANVFNPRKAIIANCNKPKSLEILSKVVATPKRYFGLVPNGETAVIRPNEHIAGKGFLVVKGPYMVEYGFHAMEYIKTKVEVRVWFCGKNTMIAQRARSADKSEHPCRSEWGYEFCGHWFDPAFGPETLKAAHALGLDCGAADVLYRDGKCIFLELNSAPSIDHWRIEKFFKQSIPLMVEGKMKGNK